ncbi:MAG: hypothetical protein RIQ81_1486 [Pseudomonadota bacterium]|jgi:hypothetical protein
MTEIKKAELKGPDAFQARIFIAINWLVANKRQVGLFLLPLVVVAVAGFTWQAVSGHLKNRRMADLAGIEEKYAKETEEAFKKADPASAGKVTPDHSASLASYLDFAKKHPGNEEGWTAGLRAANILLDKEAPEHESARKQIEAVVAKSTASRFHQILGRFMLLAVLEDTKQYDEALKHAAALSGILDAEQPRKSEGKSPLVTEIKPRLLLSKARIELAKNSKDDARATLNSIIKDHGFSEEAATARAMLTMAAAN